MNKQKISDMDGNILKINTFLLDLGVFFTQEWRKIWMQSDFMSGKDIHEGLFDLLLYHSGLSCLFKSLNLIECQIHMNPNYEIPNRVWGQKGLLRTTLKV